MKLSAILAVQELIDAGGPGSGCTGPNCGRPPGIHEELLNRGFKPNGGDSSSDWFKHKNGTTVSVFKVEEKNGEHFWHLHTHKADAKVQGGTGTAALIKTLEAPQSKAQKKSKGDDDDDDDDDDKPSLSKNTKKSKDADDDDDDDDKPVAKQVSVLPKPTGEPSTDINSYKKAEDPESVVAKSGNYTPEEKRALDYYKGAGYLDINDTLYHGGKPVPGFEQNVKSIDSAMKKGALTTNTQLFRFATLDKDTLSGITNLKPGGTFSLKGYQSTTIDPTNLTGDDFTENATVAFRIMAPRGSHAVTFGYKKGDEEDDEGEVLLPRNSTFKVVQNSGVQSSGMYKGQHLIDMVLVSGGSKKKS